MEEKTYPETVGSLHPHACRVIMLTFGAYVSPWPDYKRIDPVCA